MIEIDFKLSSRLPSLPMPFDEGVQAFQRWLQKLQQVPTFDVVWGTQFERDGPKIMMEPDSSAYFDRFRSPDDDPVVGFAVRASEGSSPRLFGTEMQWGGIAGTAAQITFYRADPRYGTAPAQYKDMIRITTDWRRPQHLDFSPTLYRAFDHPLDRTCQGIGWMGWLPFALTPADVPEAAVVMPMNGGTFIQSVPNFWQAPHLARQPDAVRDEATIARVQDVEIRLNLLGVLPTAADLATGNWGR